MTTPNARSGNSNLPFDPRMTSYSSIGTEDSRGQGPNNQIVDVLRGYIRTDERVLDSYRKDVGRQYLYFLYNPSGIITNYSMQMDQPQLAKLFNKGAGQADALVTSLSQTLEFSLLFDRTYEVREGDKEGAWKDVRAALALAGVLTGTDAGQIYTTGSDTSVGAMAMRAMYFHFGNQKGGLTYYAYMTNLAIEYTHFSRSMIPIRVGMRISAVMLPNNEQKAPDVADYGLPDSGSATNLDDQLFNPTTGDFNSEQLQAPLFSVWNN